MTITLKDKLQITNSFCTSSYTINKFFVCSVTMCKNHSSKGELAIHRNVHDIKKRNG